MSAAQSESEGKIKDVTCISCKSLSARRKIHGAAGCAHSAHEVLLLGENQRAQFARRAQTSSTKNRCAGARSALCRRALRAPTMRARQPRFAPSGLWGVTRAPGRRRWQGRGSKARSAPDLIRGDQRRANSSLNNRSASARPSSVSTTDFALPRGSEIKPLAWSRSMVRTGAKLHHGSGVMVSSAGGVKMLRR